MTSQAEFRRLVQFEAADGWSDPDLDPDDYEWSFEWLPTNALKKSMIGGKFAWESWYEGERERSDREPEYWAQLEKLWTTSPSSVGPIIVAERSPGLFDIGDGWHRTAIAVIHGMHVVPAIIGRSRAKRVDLA